MRDDIQRDPVNRQAAIVTSKTPRSAEYTPLGDPSKSKHQFDGNVKAFLAGERTSLPSHVPDRTGLVIDRLTVIGYSHSRHVGKRGWKHYWIVRCVCGRFEAWVHKALPFEGGKEARCMECKRTDYLKFLANNPDRSFGDNRR